MNLNPGDLVELIPFSRMPSGYYSYTDTIKVVTDMKQFSIERLKFKEKVLFVLILGPPYERNKINYFSV